MLPVASTRPGKASASSLKLFCARDSFLMASSAEQETACNVIPPGVHTPSSEKCLFLPVTGLNRYSKCLTTVWRRIPAEMILFVLRVKILFVLSAPAAVQTSDFFIYFTIVKHFSSI